MIYKITVRHRIRRCLTAETAVQSTGQDRKPVWSKLNKCQSATATMMNSDKTLMCIWEPCIPFAGCVQQRFASQQPLVNA